MQACTDVRTGRHSKAETVAEAITGFYEHPGYKATFLTILK